MSVWESLSSADRAKLKKHLPKPMDDSMLQKTLVQLFSGSTFHFDNPVKALFTGMKGILHIPVTELTNFIAREYKLATSRANTKQLAVQKQEHVVEVCAHHNSMIKKALTFRKGLGLDDSALLKSYPHQLAQNIPQFDSSKLFQQTS